MSTAPDNAAAPLAGAGSVTPIVGLVMGSDSDWPVMEAAAEALSEFGIPFEADVVSAHRMPTEMIRYGQSAHERGLRLIIAGAGGAAHLPGMLASVTPLPVIGVPVPLKTLDGMDSLLSIVQMPAGVPVATVSIGGARNAGLLAVRMLASGTDELALQLRADLIDFAQELNDVATRKGASLREKVSEVFAEGNVAPRSSQKGSH
ncbi:MULTISPECIES: 5-(carboxyamino)imidazole ribonucleotide mutase [Arthrobacter]|uniref:N5-carboxyaminoimidazole ribonucleotide mutase n=1 Tax=Arthrobacter humicola TaxID=409291 RepID=A0ABN2YW78_9MICC|nr:5-(carboxyamino)imidazole ribonucleotide mutase [Arthrobacter sp. H-02-3]PVZ58962.1 5-(carboxyamino)imidazole ribonucleotide mutase [Arthrobacter sp. H-02-3]